MDYITKPFQKNELLARVKTQVELKQFRDKLEKYAEEMAALSMQLFLQTTTDELTGAINRKTGMEMLEGLITKARTEGTLLSVCFVDIDDLKVVNDCYGHNEGDHLIKTVAQVLMGASVPTDSVARLGGDEFFADTGC